MADTDIDERRPIDNLVVECPPGVSHVTAEMVAELARLVDTGIIRTLDLVVPVKDEHGNFDALELEDPESVDEFRMAEPELAELPAADGVADLAAAMEPGTAAGVPVWENARAAPFAAAARRQGGQLIAIGRIPIQAILASLEADQERRLTCHSDLDVEGGAGSSEARQPGPPRWWERPLSSHTGLAVAGTGGRTEGIMAVVDGMIAGTVSVEEGCPIARCPRRQRRMAPSRTVTAVPPSGGEVGLATGPVGVVFPPAAIGGGFLLATGGGGAVLNALADHAVSPTSRSDLDDGSK